VAAQGVKDTMSLGVLVDSASSISDKEVLKSRKRKEKFERTFQMPLVNRFLLSGFLAVCSLYGADEGFVLHDATPVRLRLSRNLSSADATLGETVDLEVLDEVKVGDALVIARGVTAIATVTKAESKKRMARGGKLDVNIDYVRLVNGDKVALRAVREGSGGGHTGAMVGGMVATSIVFFPAAPFFLFMHGKDVTIPKGTEITAYTNGEIKLDIAKFVPTEASAARSAPQANVPLGPKLTNADVLKLKEAGLSDDLIIAKIKASGADYSLGVDDLLELKKANVTDGIVAAMLEASKR
jgi:hypothetical protein